MVEGEGKTEEIDGETIVLAMGNFHMLYPVVTIFFYSGLALA